MAKKADDYWDDSALHYRFPDLATALKYAEGMIEDSWFTITDPGDSLLMAKYEKVFG